MLIKQPAELKNLNVNMYDGELVIYANEGDKVVNIRLNAEEFQVLKSYINEEPSPSFAQTFIANGFMHTPSFSEEDIKLFTEILEELILPSLSSLDSFIDLRFGSMEANTLYTYGITFPDSRTFRRFRAFLISKGFKAKIRHPDFVSYRTTLRVSF